MSKSITITYNSREKSIQTATALHQKLKAAGFLIYDTYDGSQDLIVAIGGDGAFIRALHDFHFPATPIVGFNTGHLGFFQEFWPEQMDEFIQSYKHNDFFLQKIQPIEATLETPKGWYRLLALNEFVVKDRKNRVIHLALKINGNHIEYFSGDGLIISSPAGSTAYNYSSGGSIVDPSLKALQITPLSPMNTNSYRSFTSSIICSSDSTVLILPEDNDERITAEGFDLIGDGIPFDFGFIKSLSITTSSKTIQLLRSKDYHFWKKVTEKFL